MARNGGSTGDSKDRLDGRNYQRQDVHAEAPNDRQ
eukprot:COSAG01_NODE_59244_length_301_cov_1.000000_2_plen_34_part_01